ncbi:MAG: radical SAM protein [Deltaproteobacteria bacterium]|nr:radical SAM protein [Deltaproteobacteria bacterium]
MPAPRLPGRSDLRLLVRHPKTVWRVAKGYARVLCGERRPLRGAEFCVTYRCQLNCAHCLTKPLIDGQRKEMSTTQAIEAMRGLGRAGAVFVNITGGEALLRRDLFDILHGVTDSGMLVTLASNGFLIDDSVARELKRCGVSIVTLSLDGPTAAVHDASRGRAGAFDALMRAVDHLKSEDIPIWFTTILTRKNAEDGSIFDTAELAKNLGATLTLNWTYAIGRHWSKKERARLRR